MLTAPFERGAWKLNALLVSVMLIGGALYAANKLPPTVIEQVAEVRIDGVKQNVVIRFWLRRNQTWPSAFGGTHIPARVRVYWKAEGTLSLIGREFNGFCVQSGGYVCGPGFSATRADCTPQMVANHAFIDPWRE